MLVYLCQNKKSRCCCGCCFCLFVCLFVCVFVCLNAWPCWHFQIPTLWIVRSSHLSIFSLTLQTILTWIDLAASPFAPPFSTTVLAADIPARPPPTTITWFAGNTAAIAAIRYCESAKSRRVTKKCLRMPKKTCLKFLKQFLYRLYLGVIPQVVKSSLTNWSKSSLKMELAGQRQSSSQ